MELKETRRNRSVKRARNRIAMIRNAIIIIIVTIIINIGVGVSAIRFGIFPKLQEIIVTSAMTTLSHSYIAYIFASSKTVEIIMGINKINPLPNSSIEQVKNLETKVNTVTVENLSTDKYKAYLLVVTDPKRVSIAAGKIGESGLLLTDIVKQNNAIAGINAGGFSDENGRGTGGTPIGFLISNGNVLYGQDGKKESIIGFDDNGVFIIGNYTLSQAKALHITNAASFVPFLIVDGQPAITQGDGGWGEGPRTVIGQKKDGTVLMLVVDGRQLGSIGITMKQAQNIMLEQGAYNAANLDGGASTTMVYDGKIVNHPCSSAGPRLLPSAFIVK